MPQGDRAWALELDHVIFKVESLRLCVWGLRRRDSGRHRWKVLDIRQPRAAIIEGLTESTSHAENRDREAGQVDRMWAGTGGTDR